MRNGSRRMDLTLKYVKFLTGIIFLNMSPLHDGDFGKVLWFKSLEVLEDANK